MEPEDLTRVIKPPRCPECGKPLLSLIHVRNEDLTEKIVWKGGEFKVVGVLERYFYEKYLCPFCWHDIASNPEEAKWILRGGGK